MSRALLLGAAMLVVGPARAQSAPAPPALRLYALDCGRIDVDDEKVFSDTGEHDGEKGVMPVSCFLVRHGGDRPLWDAGLGDEIAASPGGRTVVGLHFRVPLTPTSQLQAIGVRPDDIRYVALSHLHADHSGNVAMFPLITSLHALSEGFQFLHGGPGRLAAPAARWFRRGGHLPSDPGRARGHRRFPAAAGRYAAGRGVGSCAGFAPGAWTRRSATD